MSKSLSIDSDLQKAALEAAANGIVLTDRHGTIIWANPAFSRLTGYSLSEIIGQNPRILKSGFHPDVFYANFWKTITAGEVWHNELLNKRKDGSIYHEEMTVTPVRNKSGEITNFIAIKQDISSRKESEERFSSAFEHAPTCMALVEAMTLSLIKVNQAFANFLGYTTAEMVGLPIRNLTYPADAAKTLEAVQRAIHGDIPLYRLEKRYVRKNQATVWGEVSATLIRDAENKPKYFITQLLDITARKETEQQIAEATRFNQALLDASPYGIMTFSADGQCQSTNRAMAQIVGGTLPAVMAQNYHELPSWKHGLESFADESLATKSEKYVETHLTTTFGKSVWLACRFTPFEYAGQPHLMLTVTDIADHKQTEVSLTSAYQDLDQSNQILSLTASISAKIIGTSSDASEILGMVNGNLGVDLISVCSLGQRKSCRDWCSDRVQRLKCAVSCGEPDHLQAMHSWVGRQKIYNGLASAAPPVIAEVLERYVLPSESSALAVPIWMRNTPWGALCYVRKTPWTTREIDAVRSLSTVIALAINETDIQQGLQQQIRQAFAEIPTPSSETDFPDFPDSSNSTSPA